MDLETELEWYECRVICLYVNTEETYSNYYQSFRCITHDQYRCDLSPKEYDPLVWPTWPAWEYFGRTDGELKVKAKKKEIERRHVNRLAYIEMTWRMKSNEIKFDTNVY